MSSKRRPRSGASFPENRLPPTSGGVATEAERWFARNPLDLTPMAGEDAYEAAIRELLESEELDAVFVGIVPLTAALATGPEEIGEPHSLARRLLRIFAKATKPMIVVIDSGPRYDSLVRALRSGGVPVFPSADQAIRSLGRYLCHRAQRYGVASA